MAYPTKYTFLRLTSKGKIKSNPIDVAKASPKERKKTNGLYKKKSSRKTFKGLTNNRGLIITAAGGGLVGRNKIIQGYNKGGQV